MHCLPRRIIPEVVVVCIVLVALGMVLYPVIVNKMERDRQQTCINNLRQFAMGISMSSSNGMDCQLPLPMNWVNAAKLSGDRKIFNCPASAHFGTPESPDYGYNGRLYVWWNGKMQNITLGEVGDPSLIEAFCDTKAPYNIPPGITDPCWRAQQGCYSVSSFSREGDARHNGGIVVSYLDGHAAWVKYDQCGRGTSAFNIPK